jgi:hypothetical protein
VGCDTVSVLGFGKQIEEERGEEVGDEEEEVAGGDEWGINDGITGPDEAYNSRKRNEFINEENGAKEDMVAALSNLSSDECTTGRSKKYVNSSYHEEKAGTYWDRSGEEAGLIFGNEATRNRGETTNFFLTGEKFPRWFTMEILTGRSPPTCPLPPSIPPF